MDVTTAVPIIPLVGVKVAWLAVELLTDERTDEATDCPLTNHANVIASLLVSVAERFIFRDAGYATTPELAAGV